MKYLCSIILILSLALGAVKAQDPDQDAIVESDTVKPGKLRILALPLLFFTPETRWGFGVGGQATFRFRNEPLSSKPSNVRPGVIYTQNRQFLLYIPWRLYWKDEAWLSVGELGYYRYNYFFFGLGNYEDTAYQEIFDVVFPRLRLNFYRRLTEELYLGLGYAFDGFDITGVEPGGLLETQPITGNTGGIVSSFGGNGIWETRDNIFYPTEGEYAEAWLLYNGPALGSDFSFWRFTFQLSKYYQVPWEHVLAFNVWTDNIWGDAPFNQMALLGGPNRLRGYYEGRYRDNHAVVTQMEYRAELFWRIGAVAHIGLGWVADRPDRFALNHTRASYGGGLRFQVDKKEKVNLRFDYGRTSLGGNFYLTVGEAF